MNLYVIDRAIKAMCFEVNTRATSAPDWRDLDENELLYEAVICIISSQMLFEVALSMADRLRQAGLIRAKAGFSFSEYESALVRTFSAPLPLRSADGTTRWIKPRFKNRLARLLATTALNLYGKRRSIKGLLSSSKTAKEARQILVTHISGFGPKQASLFLRRIGFCSDLAVIDAHILSYLNLARGLAIEPHKLGRISFYERIEEQFREVAWQFGHTIGCVDLAMWTTMRVAKREAYI